MEQPPKFNIEKYRDLFKYYLKKDFFLNLYNNYKNTNKIPDTIKTSIDNIVTYIFEQIIKNDIRKQCLRLSPTTSEIFIKEIYNVYLICLSQKYLYIT